MSAHATVLLAHRESRGLHYDWMLDDPLAPPGLGKLITFRIAITSSQWRQAKLFDAERLPGHRRAYLTYEGEISGGRGSVSRADAGAYHVRLWRESRFVVDVAMGDFAGRLEATRISDDAWRVRVIQPQ